MDSIIDCFGLVKNRTGAYSEIRWGGETVISGGGYTICVGVGKNLLRTKVFFAYSFILEHFRNAFFIARVV